MLIMMLFLTIMAMNMSPSPLKLSLYLTYISIIMSMVTYKITNSIFVPSVVVISFSSGMMILFSYCSIMCTYKEKSFTNKNLYLLALVVPLVLFNMPTKNSSCQTMKSMMEVFHQSNYLIFLMFMVIITMVGINICFFNPTKKFFISY